MQKDKDDKVKLKLKKGKNFMMKKMGLCMDKIRLRDAPLSLDLQLFLVQYITCYNTSLSNVIPQRMTCIYIYYITNTKTTYIYALSLFSPHYCSG